MWVRFAWSGMGGLGVLVVGGSEFEHDSDS